MFNFLKTNYDLHSKKLWLVTWATLSIILFFIFLHRTWFIPDSDYIAYYNAGARALKGDNLYLFDQTPFKYLPVTSVFFIPFSLLPYQISKIAFYICSYFVGFFVYRNIIIHHGNKIALITLFAMIRFHNYDFLNSQVNHLLLGLFYLFLKLRNNKPILSSLVFGVFASFKVVPLLMLAPLAILKKFRELFYIVCFLTLLSIIPIFLFKDGFQIYAHWYELLKTTTEYPAPNGSIIQSIQAALWFWIGPIVSNLQYFSLLSLLVQGVFIAICCKAALRVRNLTQENGIILASLILSIVISPLAWKHNFLLALPAFVFLLEQKKYRAVYLSILLMTGVAATIGLVSKDISDRSYSLLFGTLVLFFTLLKSDLQEVTKF